MATTQKITTGRRKESVARVRLVPGTGTIIARSTSTLAARPRR
jgi:ribosomal protein S9